MLHTVLHKEYRELHNVLFSTWFCLLAPKVDSPEDPEAGQAEPLGIPSFSVLFFGCCMVLLSGESLRVQATDLELQFLGF